MTGSIGQVTVADAGIPFQVHSLGLHRVLEGAELKSTEPRAANNPFTYYQFKEDLSKVSKLTILSGGSLGSWVDEERSQLRELM